MPAYVNGAAGIKWVSVYPHNPHDNLPSVMACIVLSDPSTGRVLAFMDGTYITGIRTGAAGGVAVKYLARKDSKVIGMIGAGTQAKTQLMAIAEVLSKIDDVKVYDLFNEASQKYVKEMHAKLGLNLHSVATIEEATEADIVVTTTPSTKQVVMDKHIRPGTHINAIGADAKGKEELEANILLRAKVIVDDIEQASHSGEINVPISQGLMTVDNIHCTLGEVVAGYKKGRESDEEITIFDSTGLAIEDIICAQLVYEKAKESGKHSYLELL
jgi:alanine dehydrogenase